ncbi:cilia- and flagella-associated protein 54-like [Physella acuta]|uniref:cilia- and flagella-associated protein 54-like n=1 Tax=Physella acuta TaxID=109671 RepID=UPI0027DDEC91|nr:cilia- and flagella-associated protein 54-like [Physella acuta]
MMASYLQNAAVSAVSKGLPSSYYTRDDRPNPVLLALEQELKIFTEKVKKQRAGGALRITEDSQTKLSTMIFEIWNKFEPRLPETFFQEKLLEIGDFLVSMQEHRLALNQCYERYLQKFEAVSTSDVNSLKESLFAGGLNSSTAILTVRALLGKSICKYQVIKLSDPKLQSKLAIARCLQCLELLRTVTQIILPKEKLCWLVFNGTVHIYCISRHLMSLGRSAAVLEFLLWASMCMETSIPLLTVKYLTWRSTLYTAVCQCYYDCKDTENAEKFARRGLNKISELSKLEMLSSNPHNPVDEMSFRSATIRMATMIFKRTVLETRRKPKGVFKPKTRANFKDVINLPWPRTSTEKMLAEMFEGSAAQFLAILEALSSSNRRVLQTSPPASENDPEILDVFCEMMMAAEYILSAGAVNKSHISLHSLRLAGVVTEGSLIQMAIEGANGVPLESVVRLMKLAYSYEHFDVFENLLSPVLNKIKEFTNERFVWEEKVLDLLSSFVKLRKLRPETSQLGIKPSSASLSAISGDDLVRVAEILMTIINGNFEKDKIDVDIFVDAMNFLWNRCKLMFQKYQTGPVDNPKFLQKMVSPSKSTFSSTNIKPFSDREENEGWMFLLETVQKAMDWCGIGSVDPTMAAEVTVRLAMAYESSAQLEQIDDKSKESKTNMTDFSDPPAQESAEESGPFFLHHGAKSSSKVYLKQAKKVLELGLKNVNYARRIVATHDGKHIADISWAKDLNPEIFASDGPVEKNKEGEITIDALMPPSMQGSGITIANTVKDLHLEMILMYNRVCLKLEAFVSDMTKSDAKQKRKSKEIKSSPEEADKIDMKNSQKNFLAKALFTAQQAVLRGTNQLPSQEQRKLLEESVNLIQRYQADERRIYIENSGTQEVKVAKVPPPPVVICRTDTFMVFKPAPFISSANEKVAYYSIFATDASGPNAKARLSDYNFPGTGEQVPAVDCELKVYNLQPNSRYVFAVAAYTADGKLIGDGIGDTSRPLLAYHPLPILLGWGYLAQLSYQVGCYDITKQACSVLWNYFVKEPQRPNNEEEKKDTKLLLFSLHERAVCVSSPIVLHQFLSTVFMLCDVQTKEGQLFCDAICEKGPLFKNQVRRLHQCEQLLVAVEMAGWLNESSLALQAVVQIYGLLAPIIYHKIPTLAVIQILKRCHAVLQEVPAGLIQRRQGLTRDSLIHMIACIIYTLAKSLRSWGQNVAARNIIEDGKSLLADEAENKSADTSKMEETLSEKQQINKGKPPLPTAVKKPSSKEDLNESMNEELSALESHMLRLTRAAASEFELTGNENPSILHSYIACLPSSVAYKEVSKFKRRQRFLEFLVQVAQKGLTEGILDQVQSWCEDGFQWLEKRNEGIIGQSSSASKKQLTDNGADKFAATMTEYSKAKEKPGAVKKQVGPPVVVRRRSKYKSLRVTSSMSDTSRKEQEDKEFQAIEKLSVVFVERYQLQQRRARLRKICADEMPWLSQLNLVQGLCHFSSLVEKMEMKERIICKNYCQYQRIDFLPQEWFSLDTAGAMVVGWLGGPVKNQDFTTMLQSTSTRGSRAFEKGGVTGLEAAAASLTGAPMSLQNLQTPRTEDSQFTLKSEKNVFLALALIDENSLSTSTTVSILRSTFAYIKRALVLAHRGQHWTLLQNESRELWNCAHTALLHAYSPIARPGKEPGLVNYDVLRSLIWEPFYVASDCLLDMLVILQVSLEKHAARARSRGKVLGSLFDSWAGDIQSEKGGASLKFDSRMDDSSIVDMQWIRKFVLRTLEMLYLQQKWEKLTDLALRFNALTNNRYAEQVIPLMVQAQRSIEKRIASVDGPRPPQPHFKNLSAQLGKVLEAKDYLKAQLQLQIEPNSLAQIQPGAQIDPIGHGTYTQEDAFRLSSVPLDVDLSLATMRETLAQSHYTARALQHSRKLLCIYLAGQQNVQEFSQSRDLSNVNFKMISGQSHTPLPPDKMTCDFSSENDIQMSPLPKSQLDKVISSYEKTIEILKAKHMKGLSAQAMHELGNIFFHSKNTRAAFKWWRSSLDTVLNMTDSLYTWRQQLQDQNDLSAYFLDRCGIWGCILGGVLASNIAQYIITLDADLKTACCFLSGYLFKALFRASLPHPTKDIEYVLYDIGHNSEVTNLIPGIDLMSDRFRCDGRQVVAALHLTIEELHRAEHNIFILPLFTLYNYLTAYVCRDLQRNVACRIMKSQALIQLKLYAEAITVLHQLFKGHFLPQLGNPAFRSTEKQPQDHTFQADKLITDSVNHKKHEVKEKPALSPFVCTKAIWSTSNYLALESLFKLRLPQQLSAVYGPNLVCHLNLALAQLFTALAGTIAVVPYIDEQDSLSTHTPLSENKAQAKDGKAKVLSKAPSFISFKTFIDPEYLGVQYSGCLTDGARTLRLEEIKLNLLSAASHIAQSLVEPMLSSSKSAKLENFVAAEVELVVKGKLLQAEIANQKHHAPMAAQLVLEALAILQDAAVFKQQKTQQGTSREETIKSDRPSSLKNSSKSSKKAAERRNSLPDSSGHYLNLLARYRLDTRLWLQCRLALVQSLLMQIQGMGKVKAVSDGARSVQTNVADCRQYCAEGLGEAEAFKNVEIQAKFLYLASQLNIIEGKSVEHTLTLIKDGAELLKTVRERSPEGEQLLATCIIFKADLEASAAKTCPDADTCLKTVYLSYLEAHSLILNQMETFGEKIERQSLAYNSAPLAPLLNIFHPLLPLLTQVKHRIGHFKARDTARLIKNGQVSNMKDMWTDCLRVLMTSLQLSQVSAMREAATESELLFLIGKIQKMLVFSGHMQPSAAAHTLLQAIYISYLNNHDLGLMRQAYLEIALIYMQKAKVIRVKNSFMFEPIKNKSGTKQDKKEQEISDEKRAVWLALRCAAGTASSQRSRNLLIGDQSVASQKLGEKCESVPDFIALDLLGGSVLGQKKKVFKTAIEEEMSTMFEAQEVKTPQTYDEQLYHAKAESKVLSWIHLLGYQSILQRLMNTSTISVSTETTADSASQFDVSANHDVVRYMLHSGVWSSRLTQLHRYLTNKLKIYATECSGAFPSHGLAQQLPQTNPLDLKISTQSYAVNQGPEVDSENTKPRVPLPPGSITDQFRPADKSAVLVAEPEVCVLWYQPSLAESGFNVPDTRAQRTQILMCYCITQKLNYSYVQEPSIMWMPLQKVTDMHNRLTSLVQLAEISLMDQVKEPTTSTSAASPSAARAKKVTQRIKPLSPKIKKDEQFEILLKQCIEDCLALFGKFQEVTLDDKSPFEITLTNIKALENMFDPRVGLTMRGNSNFLQWLINCLQT